MGTWAFSKVRAGVEGGLGLDGGWGDEVGNDWDVRWRGSGSERKDGTADGMAWGEGRDVGWKCVYSAWWNGRQTGIREKTGEGLDGSGDGIRVGARRDGKRFGMRTEKGWEGRRWG